MSGNVRVDGVVEVNDVMLVMWLTRSSRVQRAQHADAALAVGAPVSDRLVAMFHAAQRLRVLEDGRHEVGIVERVRRRDGGPAVRRRAAGTQRLAAAVEAARGRPRAPADVAEAGGGRAVRQRPASADRLRQL